MTLEEYINTNLMNAVLRGFTKDGEITVRLKGIRGRVFVITFVTILSIPELLRVDVPIEGFVITFVGKLKSINEGLYEYEALDKVGILQRRTKPRYAAFEECSIYGFDTVIIDVSENGCQVISEFKPKLKEKIEMKLERINSSIVDGTVMWVVEEEECYRYGIFIENISPEWKDLVENYKQIGEGL
ncbi:MAG: PilZ domain-containing protein [Fervidobacterium sp.]|uniref:PilZ domain-containing protein n=1 Tax=Fervidobacterium sp. TaxID=1871331 RepID=UPI004049C567